MRRDNRDIFTFFPRKSLRLVLQSLRKRIAFDGIHKATMNLLSFFVNAESSLTKDKDPSLVSKKRKEKKRGEWIVVRVVHYIAL